MNRDREIYGVATVYLREHGEDAVKEAVMPADSLLEVGDLDGRNVSDVTHIGDKRLCHTS